MKILLLSLLVSISAIQAEVLSYGIIGDAGVWNSKTQQIQKSMREGGIRRLILPGDNLYDPLLTYAAVWDHWKDFSFDVVALGNHFKTYQEEIEYFKMPGEYFRYEASPGVAFLVLNSDNENTATEQIGWLRAELEKSQDKILIVVYHHPSYTVSERHFWKEKKIFQEGVRPLLRKFKDKIDLLIVGHDHIATLVDIGSLPMVVAGASFEALSAKAVSYKAEDGTLVQSRWVFKGDAHWTRLDIDTENEILWLNFIHAAGEKVVCSAMLKHSGTWLKDSCLPVVLKKEPSPKHRRRRVLESNS